MKNDEKIEFLRVLQVIALWRSLHLQYDWLYSNIQMYLKYVNKVCMVTFRKVCGNFRVVENLFIGLPKETKIISCVYIFGENKYI